MKSISDITVEDGFPIPAPRRRWLEILRGMKAGQSFIVPDSDERDRVLRTASYQGIKITTRKIHAVGYRIWKL